MLRSEAEDERKGVAVRMATRVRAFLCRSGPASQLYRDVRRACKSVDLTWHRLKPTNSQLAFEWQVNQPGYLGGTLERAVVVCSKSEPEF